ncbi:MAG: A/G-specific adenine glycosylase [Bacteroidaceae bacterium]|nr:A/G-specific adenine glycosylase [Bacteroidaceae bacterium]
MKEISKILLDWYSANKRELPWRETTDPYRIWISEIILQQTRIVQGYEYFLKFIERFPNVQELAKADEDEVLKYWQGLGYYSRARNLHIAAKSIANRETFPVTYEEVRSLKGVGDYTAAAICSIAYGLPYAVVDGNVYRVISRLFGIDTPIDSGKGKKLFAELAQSIMCKYSPGIYNQAIMDFGAIQCTPQKPLCHQCPLAEKCYAYHYSKQNTLPVKQHHTKIKKRYFNYIDVHAGIYTFINKREKDDIWKNLYELPLIETTEEIDEATFYSLPEFQALIKTNEKPLLRCVCKGIKHILSHRIIYANFYEVILPEDTSSFSSYQRIKRIDLDSYPVSRLVNLYFEKK